MSKTAIEWATHTENFFTGCDRVSPACANCYALELAAKLQRWQQARIAKGTQHKPNRYAADGDPRTSGPGFGFTVHWDKLEHPSHYAAGSRVFVQSMSDTFHERAPVQALDALWTVFAAQPAVDWLVLTKRADRMRDYLSARGGAPLENVWLGVTVENRSAYHRLDDLRATPAAVRYVSAEPLLGPLADIDLEGIDWLIAGGESGSGRDTRKLVDVDADNAPYARKLEWVRDLRDVCAAGGTAFFFKQWGGRTPKAGGRELDGQRYSALPARRELPPGSMTTEGRGDGTQTSTHRRDRGSSRPARWRQAAADRRAAAFAKEHAGVLHRQRRRHLRVRSRRARRAARRGT